MDVIVKYGIKYKKCNKESYSGYNRNALFPFLLKNLVNNNQETVFALMAEIHCSSYYKELDNFIISFLSNHCLLSDVTYPFFLDRIFCKFANIKSVIPKSQQNVALINSNEIRNSYSSIFSHFVNAKKYNLNTKIAAKCHLPEFYLPHCCLESFHNVVDSKNQDLGELLSRGLREILFFTNIQVNDVSGKISNFVNLQNLDKIIYWIHWTYKVENMHKKINQVKYQFSSSFNALKKRKFVDCWEYFLWDKVWQKCQSHSFPNKKLFHAMTNLFFHNYTHSKVKERAGLLGVAILLCNSQLKISLEKKITKMEVFANINSNLFYTNIKLEEDNEEIYMQLYNNFNNIHEKDRKNNEKVYKQNKMDTKMGFLHNYLPKAKQENVADYFSK